MDYFVPNILYWEGIYVIAFWFLALWLVSRNSGWSALARQYALLGEQAEAQDWLGWQTLKIDGVPYPRCIWVALDDNGLALKTGPDILLRPAHPPLFIPWRDLELATDEPGKPITLTVGDKKLTLPESTRQQAMTRLHAGA